jgi:hypothetical protein
MNTTTKKAKDLPAGITPEDCTYPKLKYSDDEKFTLLNPEEQTDYNLGNGGILTFHNTEGFGWCLATLPIGGSRGTNVDRTYGIRVSDGNLVRVGAGPHVTDTITVYLRKGRLNDLQKYVDMYNTGMSNANTARDHISTRRAQGSMYRAMRRSLW